LSADTHLEHTPEVVMITYGAKWGGEYVCTVQKYTQDLTK